MDYRSTKRHFKSKRSVLLWFFFVFFVFFIVFPILKFENIKPLSLASKSIVKEVPYYHLSVTSKPVKKPVFRHQTRKAELIIESTVLLPDFFLVILKTNVNVSSFDRTLDKNRIHCFYPKQLEETEDRIVYRILSIEEYEGDRSRWIVRCPLPPPTHPVLAGLEVRPDENTGFNWVAKMTENQTEKSWSKMLVYEATFDGEQTVAVFVKGLRLNGERKSNPSQFRCRFGDDFGVITKAITAAQEVIRCPLPRGVTKSIISRKNKVIRVTIERVVESKVRGINQIVPSIAKLLKSDYHGHKNKHDLCACTMVWNQAAFIKEWVVYHAWLGIQRWFVYDNNSDDGLNEVINDLNSDNYNVTRHVWPWIKSQEAGFAHCLLKARDECNWIGFFDVDEFYYVPITKPNIDYKGRNSLRAIVQNVKSKFPSQGQIRTDCYNFGPSGLKASPKEGVSLGYTCRLKVNDRHKSIVRPEAVDESLLNRVHHFELKTGYSARKLPQRTAVINHYKYQVWDVFKAKFVRRVSAYVSDWQEKNSEKSKDRTPGLGTQAIQPQNWHLRFCQVWDTKLRDFITTNLVLHNTSLPWQN